MIQQARKACYSFSSLKNLLPEWREMAFAQSNDQCCLHSLYQCPVTFSLGDVEQVVGKQFFHLVLCRNLVFTYFNIDRQMQFLQKLRVQLVKGGVLVLDAQERLPEEISGWRQWHDDCRSIYVNRLSVPD